MSDISALITGIAGFVGPHLTRHLQANGVTRIAGIIQHPSKGVEDSLGRAVRLFPVDIRDGDAMATVVREVQPDLVFHLAAQSSVHDSMDKPVETFDINVMGSVILLEAVRQFAPQATLLLASSAEVYGIVRERDLPLREDYPLNPVSPYAASKAAQDLLFGQYHLSYGLRTIRIRAFNHIGPGQGDRFAVASFSRQIAAIERGKQEPVIRVGNLDARRDFTDVRDVVAGYYSAALNGEAGSGYNLCSGRAVSMREILDQLLSLSTAKIHIEVDPARLRPSDVPILVGDHSALRKATGWEPTIPLERSLRDILNYWRACA